MQAIIDLAEKTLVLERNGFLKVSGSIDTHVYYVESGSLRVYVFDGEEEQIIRFGYKGNLLVSMDSFLTGKPSESAIQAIKKTVVRIINKQKLEEYLNAQPNQHYWKSILENTILQQLEREMDILTQTPVDRYQRVLKRSPQLFQEIPHRYIANYLRMTPKTLSRLKKS
jgi:CRP-like cAMP-binding protein